MVMYKCMNLVLFQMSQMLEDKDDQISRLQEKVTLTEQRLKDTGLSEDDRVKALETEVGILVYKCI